VINISVSTSSASKGETLLDTVKNLEAMQPDVIVLRHSASGAPHFVAARTRAGVVNAGDGTHEHPTQALLDAFTIRRAKGKLEGLVVAICGDIAHSRVARSNATCCAPRRRRCASARRARCCPRPRSTRRGGLRRLEPALEGADVVMMLRIQRERLTEALIPSTREYSRTFGLNRARLALAKPDAIVMHPGP
jgi:aspartate carbamoyltransferase catalytic subunit